MEVLYYIYYRGCNTAWNRKVTAISRSIVHTIGIFFNILNIYMLWCKYPGHLFKGKYKVHLWAHLIPHSFKLLGWTRSNEYNLTLWIVVLYKPCCKSHRSKRHWNALLHLREELLCHRRPRRTAGSTHKWQLVRHLFKEVVCFLGSTEVSTYSHLENVSKAKHLHSHTYLTRSHLRAKLTYKGRGKGRIDMLTWLDCSNYLEYLRFVCNCPKRTVYQALAAGYTSLIVYVCLSVYIWMNGVHTAGCSTRSFLLDDGVIRTDIGTFSTLNA